MMIDFNHLVHLQLGLMIQMLNFIPDASLFNFNPELPFLIRIINLGLIRLISLFFNLFH
jgi:hypothetical protein